MLKLLWLNVHNISGSYAILFFTVSHFTFYNRHIHNWKSFLLWPSHFFLIGAISNCSLYFPSNMLDTVQPWGGSCLGSTFYTFAFPYCPWASPGKHAGVCCHFLLQWILFCQNSSLWPIFLEWPCTEWLIAPLSYESPFVRTRLWSMKARYV